MKGVVVVTEKTGFDYHNKPKSKHESNNHSTSGWSIYNKIFTASLPLTPTTSFATGVTLLDSSTAFKRHRRDNSDTVNMVVLCPEDQYGDDRRSLSRSETYEIDRKIRG